jgi:hypothetical protein
MDVEENMLQVTEENRLQCFGHVREMPEKTFPRRKVECMRERTRRVRHKKDRWMRSDQL